MIKITHYFFTNDDGSKYVVVQTRIFGLLWMEKIIELESGVMEVVTHDN